MYQYIIQPSMIYYNVSNFKLNFELQTFALYIYLQEERLLTKNYKEKKCQVKIFE